MTPIENATLDFWCAAFARRRDLPMTDLLRGGFDEVLIDLTTSAPTGTLRDCAREAVLSLGIVQPNFTAENGGAA
jgi:hypothetical protein